MRPYLAFLLAIPLAGQIFPPFPGIPGIPGTRMPGSRRPGTTGTPGSRMPGSGTGTGTGTGIPGTGRSGGSRTSSKTAEKAIATRTVEGMLRLRDAKRLILSTDDKRTILVQHDKQSDFGKLTLDKLQPGDFLRIDAREDDESYLFAVTVDRVREGTPEERAQARQPLPQDALGTQVEMEAQSKRPSLSGPAPGTEDPSRSCFRPPAASHTAWSSGTPSNACR